VLYAWNSSLALTAPRRALELRAAAEGAATDVVRECWEAVCGYEWMRSRLESLRTSFPALLGETVAAFAAETDHDNFKSAVARHQDRKAAAYQQARHEVWDVMYRLQK
jgi:hypothetical protein